MEIILHILGFCGDSNSHVDLLDFLIAIAPSDVRMNLQLVYYQAVRKIKSLL